VDFDPLNIPQQSGADVPFVDRDDLCVKEEPLVLQSPAGEFAVAEVPFAFGRLPFEFADADTEGIDVAQEVAGLLGVLGELGLDEAMEQ